MKTWIKYIANGMGILCSFIFPSDLPVLFRAVMAYFYTGYLKRRFAIWGHKSIIAFKAANLSGLEYIQVGEQTEIDKNVCLTAWKHYRTFQYAPQIVIGNNCHIGAGAHITSIHGITIGDNLLTGTNILITDNAHGASERELLDVHPEHRPLYSKGKVEIGHNVWLGNNVCILPGVTVGNGVIVAANSVVTKSVPDYTVVAGVPAQIVKRIN